jgi:hypothetical protein
MSIVDKIKAYKAAVAPVASKDTVLRYPLSTQDAIGLAGEINFKGSKDLAEALDALAKVGDEPESTEEKITYYDLMSKASKQFWREFSGTVVEGVEVIRSK